jgi:phospholipase C
MMSRLSRRSLLAGLSAAPFGLLPRLEARSQTSVPPGTLPSPASSGIEHIVLVMMENRSFDHLLGWMPDANTKQINSYRNKSGKLVSTYHLTNLQNCDLADPDHSYNGGRTEFANGSCNGWLLANTSDTFSIGYYEQTDLAFLGNAARDWTVCDNYFAAIMSSTYPNRVYQHAGQTDRVGNTINISSLPTIWDRLSAAGLEGRYYFSDVPVLALWGVKYAPITRTIAEFFSDAASGNLPEVSFIDPRFVDEVTGTSGDDHPHADLKNGEGFMNQIYNAVRNSPQWDKTVLVINFDEWGGFFDHVAPPTRPIPPVTKAAGDSDGRLGFRVPAIVISPWSPRASVNSTQFDHTSVLNMIEWRWDLPSLSIRDETANNIATVLDFANPNLASNSYNVPTGVFGNVCWLGIFSDLGLDAGKLDSSALNVSNMVAGKAAVQLDDEDQEWAPIKKMAKQFGFRVDD